MEKQIDYELFERIVFYNCLVDSVYLGGVHEYITPSIFKNKDIKAVVGILTDFYKKRGTTPSVTEIKVYLTEETLKQHFKAALESIKDIDKKYNKDELYANTQTFLKERHVFNTLLEAADKLDSKSLDTYKLLQKIEKAVNIDLSTSTGLNLLEDIDRFLEELNVDEPTISSGISWLDHKLGGGFAENGRALYLFMGETNVGKSIFLGNIATNIAIKGKKVLLVTLEMSEVMYSKRLASSITKIPISDLKSQQQTLKQMLLETKSANKDASILIKEFPPSTITPGHLGAFIKKIKQSGYTPDAIVLDYLNLLAAPYGDNSYERVKVISEKIRALSYEFSCPIVSATQINRTGYGVDEPGLETISESTGLAATADAIFSIWQKDEDKDLGIVNLGIVKNRFGQNFGFTPLRINYNTLTITEDNIIVSTDEALNFSKSISQLVD